MEVFRNNCDRPWDFSVDPFEVVHGVYYIGGAWVGSYLIDTGDGLILIDAMMPQTVYLLFESIRKLGFDPKDIKYILISHAHYDHCGGIAQVAHYTDAEIFMGKEDLYFLTERTDLIIVYKDTFEPFKVDHYFCEDETINLGNISIQAIHTPGHTPGTYSFFFDVEDQGKTYRCGMHGGIGVNTLTAEYLQESRQPFSLRDDFLNSIERLSKMHVDITLGSHPNHADMLGKAARKTEGSNPFIDQTTFNRLLEARKKDMLDIIEREH